MTALERLRRLDPDHRKRLAERYTDDALGRLANANPDYYNSHGHYLPELATLLLAERAEVEQRDAKVERLIAAGNTLRSLYTRPWNQDGVRWDEAVADLRKEEA